MGKLCVSLCMADAKKGKRGHDRDPREELIARNWSQCGYRKNTINNYLCTVRRLRPYLVRHSKREETQLTSRDVTRAAKAYARDHELAPGRIVKDAKGTFQAWAAGLRAIGVEVPPWVPPRACDETIEALLDEYCRHRRCRRGVAHSSLSVECRFIRSFLDFIKKRRRSVSRIRLSDIDSFVEELARGRKPKTIAGACSALRSFLRFLHSSGKLPDNLSNSVLGPLVSASERPPRVLPWRDVQRILAVIDRRTAAGKRDFALLLMMATYGLGAAEVCGLELDDIDWNQGTFHVVRRKTGVETSLPLLPAVARALVAYLRHRQRQGSKVRAVFLRLIAPVQALNGASAICSLLRKYAKAAGVTAKFLGSHALRHSHASRQVDQGVQPKVLSEILGHADARSVSVYIRVAMRRLRSVALPVPL